MNLLQILYLITIAISKIDIIEKVLREIWEEYKDKIEVNPQTGIKTLKMAQPTFNDPFIAQLRANPEKEEAVMLLERAVDMRLFPVQTGVAFGGGGLLQFIGFLLQHKDEIFAIIDFFKKMKEGNAELPVAAVPEPATEETDEDSSTS